MFSRGGKVLWLTECIRYGCRLWAIIVAVKSEGAISNVHTNNRRTLCFRYESRVFFFGFATFYIVRVEGTVISILWKALVSCLFLWRWRSLKNFWVMGKKSIYYDYEKTEKIPLFTTYRALDNPTQIPLTTPCLCCRKLPVPGCSVRGILAIFVCDGRRFFRNIQFLWNK